MRSIELHEHSHLDFQIGCYSRLTAESLFAEADTADTDLVHGRAVELQAHDPELRGIENFRVPRRLKSGEQCTERLEHDFPVLVVTLVVQYRELREFLHSGALRDRDGWRPTDWRSSS